jgi:hypothetical protein
MNVSADFFRDASHDRRWVPVCNAWVLLAPLDCGGRWWVAVRGHLSICIARLCATPGPLGPVENEAPDHRRRRRRCWWVVARSPTNSASRASARRWGFLSSAVVMGGAVGAPPMAVVVGGRWVAAHGHLVVDIAHLCATSRPLGLSHKTPSS